MLRYGEHKVTLFMRVGHVHRLAAQLQEVR
jgi:hypothetical protein